MYVGPESLLVAARIDLADDLPASAVEALADQIDAIAWRRPDRGRGFPRSYGAEGMTATPGSSWPSSNSSAAPPPVDSHDT
jgi:hypothetical protein